VQRSLLSSLPSSPVPLAEMFSPANRLAGMADRVKQAVPESPSVTDLPAALPPLPGRPAVPKMPSMSDLPESLASAVPDVSAIPGAAQLTDVGGFAEEAQAGAAESVLPVSGLPAGVVAAGTSATTAAAQNLTNPGASAPPDIEELARQLYEPLTARLRAELWLDRERSGLLTDR
jgi:hypothetical protein